MKKKKRSFVYRHLPTIAVLTAFAAVVLLVVVYFVGKSYYSDRLLPGTYVDGKNVSGMKIEKFWEETKNSYPQTVTLTEKNRKPVQIIVNDLFEDKELKAFVESQEKIRWKWMSSAFKRKEADSSKGITIRKDELLTRLNEAVHNDTRLPSKDAEFDPVNMTVVREMYGNTVDTNTLLQDIINHVNRQSYVVSVEDSYVVPTVLENDPTFIEMENAIDAFLEGSPTLNINIDDDVYEVLTKEDMRKLLAFGEYGVEFNYDKVREYVHSLVEKYYTIGSVRKFRTSLGTIIEVGGQSTDNYVGYSMNEEETFINILGSLNEECDIATCVWASKGYGMNEMNDIGDTYIEVSIDGQHMWFYEDGNLVFDTDVVTGTATDPEKVTPRGLFNVLEMISPYVMHGDYGEQPCTYFIRVTWDGVAIHDADWQPIFGGDYYVNNGSHGCINTPFEYASTLWYTLQSYDNFHVPVIFY